MRGKLRTFFSCIRRKDAFNEARALCAGSYGTETHARTHGAPSMRPAHYAREVSFPLTAAPQSTSTFNEARALCAGSWRLDGHQSHPHLPSMRPAHYAREVADASGPPAAPKATFNEARALCAGSWFPPWF